MQIHELKRQHKLKKEKRVGRGGKRGTTAGRGQKGQKSRAGRKLKHNEKEIILRFPKLRGHKNIKVPKEEPIILKTSALFKLSDNGKLNKEVLFRKHIIKKLSTPVKVLFDKEVEQPIECEGILFSKRARESVIKAGGQVK